MPSTSSSDDNEKALESLTSLIEEDNTDELKKFLKKHSKSELKSLLEMVDEDDDNKTALAKACSNSTASSSEIAKLIIAKIVEVGGNDLLAKVLETRDDDGENCLMVACSVSPCAAIISLIIDKIRQVGGTPLLIKHLTATDNAEANALRNACYNVEASSRALPLIVDTILEVGGPALLKKQLTATDAPSCLMLACSNSSREGVKLIIDKIIELRGKVELKKELYEEKDDEGQTCVMMACMNYLYVEVAIFVMEQVRELCGNAALKEKLTEADENGMNCFLIACRYSCDRTLDTIKAVLDKVLEVGDSKMLREQLTATDNDDWNCLAFVFQYSNSIEVVEFLVAKIVEAGGEKLLADILNKRRSSEYGILDAVAAQDGVLKDTAVAIIKFAASLLFHFDLFKEQYGKLEADDKKHLKKLAHVDASWKPDAESIHAVKKILATPVSSRQANSDPDEVMSEMRGAMNRAEERAKNIVRGLNDDDFVDDDDELEAELEELERESKKHDAKEAERKFQLKKKAEQEAAVAKSNKHSTANKQHHPSSEEVANTARHKEKEEAKEKLQLERKHRADEAFRNKQYEEAIRLYDSAVDIAPDLQLPCCQVYSNRAACYQAMGIYQNAIFDAKRCIAARPEWFEGYLRHGYALRSLGGEEKAMAAFKKALELNPGDKELQSIVKENHEKKDAAKKKKAEEKAAAKNHTGDDEHNKIHQPAATATTAAHHATSNNSNTSKATSAQQQKQTSLSSSPHEQQKKQDQKEAAVYSVDSIPPARCFKRGVPDKNLEDAIRSLFSIKEAPSNRPDLKNWIPDSDDASDLLHYLNHSLPELKKRPVIQKLIAENHLTDDDIKVLHSYKVQNPYPVYLWLNGWLGGDRRDDFVKEHVAPFFTLLYRAMEKLPRVKTVADRAIKVNGISSLQSTFANFKIACAPKSTLSFWGFSSFSTADDVVNREEFVGKLSEPAIVYSCGELEGVDMEPFAPKGLKDESEILPLCPCVLEVQTAVKMGQKLIIGVKQLDHASFSYVAPH